MLIEWFDTGRLKTEDNGRGVNVPSVIWDALRHVTLKRLDD
jgi:hypothetical protein